MTFYTFVALLLVIVLLVCGLRTGAQHLTNGRRSIVGTNTWMVVSATMTAALLLPPWPAQMGNAVLYATLLLCAWSDLESGFIFDAVTFPSLCALLVIELGAGDGGAAPGMLLAGGMMYALHAATRGRGLGLGDVKLACCMGVALGPAGALRAIGCSFTVGGIYAAWRLFTRRGTPKDAVAFGPFLFAGTLAAQCGALLWP